MIYARCLVANLWRRPSGLTKVDARPLSRTCCTLIKVTVAHRCRLSRTIGRRCTRSENRTCVLNKLHKGQQDMILNKNWFINVVAAPAVCLQSLRILRSESPASR